MPKKEPQAPPKAAPTPKPRRVEFYVTDPNVLNKFDLWVKKLALEGKIEKALASHAFVYLVNHVGDVLSPARENGALPLDGKRRETLEFLKATFGVTGAMQGTTDNEAVGAMIDLVAELFGNQSFYQAYINKKRGAQ